MHYRCTSGRCLAMYFCATIHALMELSVYKGCNLYYVGGGIGQDPATEVTHLE